MGCAEGVLITIAHGVRSYKDTHSDCAVGAQPSG